VQLPVSRSDTEVPEFGKTYRYHIGKTRQIYSDVDDEAPWPKEMVSRKSGRDTGNTVAVIARKATPLYSASIKWNKTSRKTSNMSNPPKTIKYSTPDYAWNCWPGRLRSSTDRDTKFPEMDPIYANVADDAPEGGVNVLSQSQDKIGKAR
jgi:hypothetical protein